MDSLVRDEWGLQREHRYSGGTRGRAWTLLWTVVYNQVLVFPVSEEVMIFGFANDLVAVVAAKYQENMTPRKYRMNSCRK